MTTEQLKETASQKYRRKLKENPELHAEHLRRERTRDSKRREVLKRKMDTDEDLKIMARIRSKERMQATRKRRKVEQVQQTSSRYSSPRTLGKAVAKVKRNLPASPTKAVEVVKKIASEFHIAPIDETDAPKAGPRKLTDEGKKLIGEFYNRDDISRQMPGIKDVKKVKSKTGTKMRIQKRTMIMNIGEAFEIFKEIHPEISVGKTVFYNERPAHILPINDTPHNVCVCTTHSNYINLLLAISKHATDFPKTHQELLKKVSCSVDNEDCMSSSCDACKESNIWDITLDSNPCVNWKAWIFENQRPKQIVMSKPFNEALDELHDGTGKFKLHSFVKNIQSDYFQNAKEDLTNEKAVVQIDFAENYALINQDEIQSAHWSHAQVTLFTCCIWTADKLHSLVIVSDELSHNKYTVHLFLQKIFEYIKSVSDIITSLYIFSDNCAAQFKNRYVMASLNSLKAEYGFNHLEWNFFAASHGKGAVDGIGGCVKRSVWIAVKSRKAIVNSAVEFYDLARSLSENIVFKFVAKEEVQEKIARLDEQWEGLKSIPGIQSKHFFQPEEAHSISVARTSMSHSKCTLILKSQTTTNTEDDKTESDWTDEDLEPLTNHQLRKEISCPDISVPSVSGQGKTNKLRVSDVYSDSDTDSDSEFRSDETPSTSIRTSKLSPEACPESETATLQAAVLPKDICTGLYVLVQLLCKTGRTKTQYRYVGLCQSDMDEDGEVRVQFMTTIDGKRFTEIVGDIADVQFDDIIAMLEAPERSVRRTTTQSSGNTTRDSQLLSVLAARRRQLLHGRLATHINTLASLANKTNKHNTTFAQLEIRDANSSVVKKITFENTRNESKPTLKLVTTDGIKETRQEIKPHEIKHLFVSKIYQENRSRAGFMNNRRKEKNTTTEPVPESTLLYIPPDNLGGVDRELEIDPEEEFQVDESNHGLYLLNYSDTDNVTQSSESQNSTTVNNSGQKDNVTVKVETSTWLINVTDEIVTSTVNPNEINKENNSTEVNTIANSTDTRNTKLLKVNSNEEKESTDSNNQTLFMSDEIYNHFRPLESELPVEDMAPFIYFGQKIGGPSISDNLTNSPTLSASTKSVNFIVAPPEKRKFNSRYSATEKYRNTSADEEEVNEDMDVSVVKNVIEKNKIRNTVKGPAPARHVGLVNAYRKHSSSTQTPSKSLNVAQLNITEPYIQSASPITVDRSKDSNRTSNNTNNTNIGKEFTTRNNSTFAHKDDMQSKTNTTTTAPRNFTRNYQNLRRRPLRLTSSTENIPLIITVNATTEKASTVYTAVVTSVSITSSMKGHNKTDGTFAEADNSSLKENSEVRNATIPKAILINDTDTSTLLPSTARTFKHRIRIRTTTTENSLNQPTSSPFVASKSTEFPTSEVSTKNSSDLKHEATTSRISERLANLFRQEHEIAANGSVIRPKNILKRRRPTTTTTTTTTTTSSTTPAPTSASSESPSETVPPVTVPLFKFYTTTPPPQTAEPSSTFKPFVVTSRTSSESSAKPLLVPMNNKGENNTVVNSTKLEDNDEPATENEVVIEAEKSYTTSYVLAGVGFLPVMAVVAFVLKNLLNKKTKEIETEYEGYFDDGDIKKESPITPVARPPIATPSKPDHKWEFPRNKLRLQTLLGQGNFGQVWKAEADDLNGHDGLTRLVAVKTIKETATQKEKQELLHEIYIMQKIGTHPNVVTLLACCTEQEPYLLIMEYVMCGKLLTYLRERRSRPDRFSGSGALTSRDLTVFAYCVARGMDYIASKGIVHRDLAARNVLVDHNKLCKIADFGMSRCAGGGSRTSRGALPVRWMAPEALLYNVYSHQTDVWAYGILLWEIVTLGSTPYAAMSGREVLTAVTEGYRLERPPHCKPQLYRAMHSCWHADPSQRPTFGSLKSQLAELLDNEPSEGNYVDLDSFYQESSVYSDPSAIIHDEEGLSAEYDRERRVFRELNKAPAKFDNRAFSLRDEEFRGKFGMGTPRMGGFGIRDVPFNERNFSDGEFTDRAFTDKNFTERNFTDTNFNDRNFTDTNFTDRNFTDKNFADPDRKEKLSTSSFHRERERENPLVSRNSFNGFPRVGARDTHFQLSPDGRNKRVSEFECDI